MGQQQLLLVILVTIIVGIATVVAINTFSSASDNANLDAVRQDMASIAASAQGYFMKPEMLGGGGNKFDGIDFNKLAFGGNVDASAPTKASNQNAAYTISSPTATKFTLTATLNNDRGILSATVQADTLIWVNATPAAAPAAGGGGTD